MENTNNDLDITQESHTNTEIPSIHTMKTDAASALGKGEVTVFDLAAKSAERRQERASLESVEQESRVPKILLITFSTILVLGGLSIGGYMLYQKYGVTPPIQEPDIPESFISTEAISEIRINEGDRTGLRNALRNEEQNRLPLGNIRYVPLKIEQFGSPAIHADGRMFLDGSNFSPPIAFRESLGSEWNYFMIYTDDGVETAFVFKIESAPRALLGLKEWESRLIDEWQTFLARDITPKVEAPKQTSVPGIVITKYIAKGTTDLEVQTLLVFLRDSGFYVGTTTRTTFDATGETALKAYQCALQIVCSGKGHGATGPKTRAKLNESYVISSTSTAPQAPTFTDRIIENIETRTYASGNNKGTISYAIFSNQYVIMSTSEETLQLLLGKFISGPIR